MYPEGQACDAVHSLQTVHAEALFCLRKIAKVKDALDLLDRHCDPLVPDGVSCVSVSGLMVLTAEDIRDEGLPGWMQVRMRGPNWSFLEHRNSNTALGFIGIRF